MIIVKKRIMGGSSMALNNIVETFYELVKIDSETKNERKFVDILKEKLENLGLSVFEDDTANKIDGTAGNLIATLPGKGKGLKVLLSAHMDTVKPGQNIVPVEKEGVITSSSDTILGADDKAGISIILEALRNIKENNINHAPIQVVFTVAEEGGLRGSKNLDENLLDADIAYVLDSSGNTGNVIVKGPAQEHVNFIIHGKAAHAGISPENGVNAIKIAAKGINDMKLGRIDEETTANIGIISGGEATNIVPEKVIVHGEARSLDKVKLEKQCEQMVESMQNAAREFNGSVEVDREITYPAINIDENETVVKVAQEAGDKIGLSVNLAKTGGGSDANIFNKYGLSTVNVAIGMEKVHSKEEFITLDNLNKAFKFVCEILKVASEK